MDRVELGWNELKAFVDTRGLSIQYVDIGNFYLLYAIDGPLGFVCKLFKSPSDTTDLDDFETNYQANANRKFGALELGGIRHSKGMRARLIGVVNQTVPKNTTTDVDWLIPQLTWAGSNKKGYFDGIQYYVKSGYPGDSCTFQIVDKDGTGVSLGLYPQAYYDAYKDGNGVLVVEEFATDWPLIPDTKGDIILYKARLFPGLYIRSRVTSVSDVLDDPYVMIGIYRHLDENS